MNAYKETILKGGNDKFDTDDIDVLIEKTKGEARYNLVLVREKLMEVEKVMKDEVLPVWNYVNDKTTRDLEKQKTYQNMRNNIDNYNLLAKEIFKKYLPGFFD